VALRGAGTRNAPSLPGIGPTRCLSLGACTAPQAHQQAACRSLWPRALPHLGRAVGLLAGLPILTQGNSCC
jgi:hypothetical protein